jgi:ABC-type nitrate/sulfonate/bicarbonate transport system ATPase subunit
MYSTKEPTIELVRRATLTYLLAGQARAVFKDLSLSMQTGTCLVLIGPNACGKSSLLRAILGLVSLNEGSPGLQLTDRDFLGAVLQNYRSQLLPSASVADNLTLPLGGKYDYGINKSELYEVATGFLHALGYDIPLTKNAQHLSGGQQQAVVLARASAFRPRFFCWDEPTSAIDFPKRGILYDLLQREWKELRSSVLMVTHDVDEALVLGDRVVVFDAQMHVLLDQEVHEPRRPRDRRFLESEKARRLHLAIRSAMIGNGSLATSKTEAESDNV